jgi:hypothetical protein
MKSESFVKDLIGLVDEKFKDEDIIVISQDAWAVLKEAILTQRKNYPFTIVEHFADNGAHSHWSVIDKATGIEIFSYRDKK